MNTLNALAFGYAGAVLSAACMLLLSLTYSVGLYGSAVEMMQAWHMFYSPTLVGTITGMIEAAVVGFIFLYVLAVLYNYFAAGSRS